MIMKFLFLSPYYTPESFSSFRLIRDIHEAIIARGHSIELYCPTPTRGVSLEVRKKYKSLKRELKDGGALVVYRFALWGEGTSISLRAFRYAVCEILFVFKGLAAKNINLLAVGSTPPIHGLTATLLHKIRGIPFVYYLADLFPDSLVNSGISHKNSFVWKIGNWISNMIYGNAARVIVVSDRLKDLLIERGVAPEKIEVVYPWIDENTIQYVKRTDNKLFDDYGLSRDHFYVTYAGNFGMLQNVELLLECAHKMRNERQVHFVLIGDGSQREKLISRIADLRLENVTLLPMQIPERVPEVYSLGDVSFVICRKGVGEGAFPSKAAVIMSVGVPLIASYDRNTDLCNLISDYKAGLCVEPNDVDAAVEAIKRFSSDSELRERCSINGLRLARKKFSQKESVQTIIDVYEQVVRETKDARYNR